MKLSDYIVEYLISKGITDVFGYPGGMVTHLMDSFSKYEDKIRAHLTYHEQAASFSACGYAQATGKVGVAYATSGPGATNMITGICNAYFDSVPCLFITGQVNSYESKGDLGVRQRGFQETDIIGMVRGVTKYCEKVTNPKRIKYCLDKAFYEAMNGRRGPVLLDIPMNVFRADINEDELESYAIEKKNEYDAYLIKSTLSEALNNSERPALLFGNGIKSLCLQQKAKKVVENLRIPSVSSMIAFDVIGDSEYNFGFIGAYGHRTANFCVAKSDLVISIGSRLDVRQVGAKRENFAPDSKLIRVDIDEGEIRYSIKEDEIKIIAPIELVLDILKEITFNKDFSKWINTCNIIKNELLNYDDTEPNRFVGRISHLIPKNSVITTDVGQNQVWVAQSFCLKNGQLVLFSGGHGAMGYSLPAAIGAYYGSKKPVYCFAGDGGFQMNIQELQYISREHLPIKIIVLNNNSLGMIRHFQEMYFNNVFYQTVEGNGYSSPDFSRIANAYGIRSIKVNDLDNYTISDAFIDDEPLLIEVDLNMNTYVFPKLEFGKPNQDQEPLLPRDKYNYLMDL